ncbi:hypothetical protein FN846DRAFT_894618 [Sphaerosporella brunnea]|uniref:Uncharacterized protein n=1 Tax=Sphaerosporella brunnea TaxID=1250544 RepID=A0A5J5EHN4_9PEZI|nr:hypothetical protein FN846DRAFT_894618 [Sphaerosporella brunnea]
MSAPPNIWRRLGKQLNGKARRLECRAILAHVFMRDIRRRTAAFEKPRSVKVCRAADILIQCTYSTDLAKANMAAICSLQWGRSMPLENALSDEDAGLCFQPRGLPVSAQKRGSQGGGGG